MIHCKFEAGNDAKLRHVVVDVILYNDDNQIMLLRRAERLLEVGKWCVPGGFVERDESASDAARRETLEETGYVCRELDFVCVVSEPVRGGRDDRQNISLLFAARAGRCVEGRDDESTDAGWYALDNLPPSDQMAFDHLRLIDLWIASKDQTGQFQRID